MTWLQSPRSKYAAMGVGSAVLGFLLAWPVFATGQDKKDPAPDPAVKQAPPADANKDLAEQIKQLNATVARLEAAVTKIAPPTSAGMGDMVPKAGDKGAVQSGRVAAKFQNCIACHQTRPSGPLPPSHLEAATGTAATGAAPMAGMGGKPAGGMGMGMMGGMGGAKKGMAGGGMGMMGGMKDGDDMMEMMQMMGMMQMKMMKMMGGMKDDAMGGMGGAKKGMSGGGAMGGMKDDAMSGMGGGMGMMDDDMDMMGMMGMGSMGGSKSKKMKMATALPGFPGASHIYHIGATDFFLDHPEHITLSTEQKTKLGQMKQKAVMEKASAQRKIDEAEQQLWDLTAADMPDAAKIDAKVREAEKSRGDQRLAFIRTVGEGALVLTDDQRKILIGQAQPAVAAPHTAHPKTP